MKYTTAA